jgi:hypothetical protein
MGDDLRNLIGKALPITLALVLALTSATPASAISPKQAVSFTKLLGLLKVKAESGSSTYERTYFQHWIDADGDGCDTRDEVLQQESKTKTDCGLAGGSWVSAYDGFKTADASSLDIDHFVPLKEAWESGASGWNSDTRKRFANDLDYSVSLIAVSASSNRSKSDRDPSAWLPPLKSFTCQYVGRWIAVKYRWSLTIDSNEKKVLASKLSSCGSKSKVAVPAKAKIVKGVAPTAAPSPSSSTPSSGTGANDPKFSSCAEAKRNGYTGSYTKGIDPEYDWYQDRDGDGVVCES